MKKKLHHIFVGAQKFFADYKGLLYALLGALLYVAIRSGIGGRTDALEMIRDFVGGYLLVFGALHVVASEKFIAAFKKYDFAGKRFPKYAQLYPYLILGMGVLLHINKLVPVIEGVVAVICIERTWSVISTISKKPKSHFHIYIGPRYTMPLSYVSAVESMVIAVCALIALYFRLVA